MEHVACWEIGDRLALAYCGELGTARHSAPCKLAWTWCTCCKIGDTVTHCYLTYPPFFWKMLKSISMAACRGPDRGSTPLPPVSDGCMIICPDTARDPKQTTGRDPGVSDACQGISRCPTPHTVEHRGMPGTVRGPVLCNMVRRRDTGGQDISPQKPPVRNATTPRRVEFRELVCR
jgi:hypothetical protein